MSENQKLKESIESAWENIANLSPSDTDVSQAVNQVIKKLDSGELRIAEKVDNLKEGTELAAEMIDTGQAKQKLDQLISITAHTG